MSFNEHLWRIINDLGFWFWLPFAVYGVYGLNKLYRLAPAETAIGRWARVFLVLGFVSMVFTLQFPALRPICAHLVAIGVCLILKQAYAACVEAGKVKPAEGGTFIERTAHRMAAKDTFQAGQR